MTTPTQPNPGEVLTGESVGETPLGIALEALIRLATGTERTFNASSARQMAASTTAIAADAMNRIASLRLSRPAPDAEGAKQSWNEVIQSDEFKALSTRPTDTPPPAAPDAGGLIERLRSTRKEGGPGTVRAGQLRNPGGPAAAEALTQAQAALAERDAELIEARKLLVHYSSRALAAEARDEGYREALRQITKVSSPHVARVARQALTAHQTAEQSE